MFTEPTSGGREPLDPVQVGRLGGLTPPCKPRLLSRSVPLTSSATSTCYSEQAAEWRFPSRSALDQSGFAGPSYARSFRRWPRVPAQKSAAARRPSATGSCRADVSCGGNEANPLSWWCALIGWGGLVAYSKKTNHHQGLAITRQVERRALRFETCDDCAK